MKETTPQESKTENYSSVAHQIASMLLEIEAVKLRPHEPFQWASGWNSPIYCDNRLTLSYPKVRTFITNALVEMIKKSFPDVTAIAGVATAGIPQAALVAHEMGLPMLYVRAKPKEHGTQSQIEGKLNPNDKIVLIEDLISTGQSSLAAVHVLQSTRANVIGMAAIFTYGFDRATRNFSQAAIDLKTLSDYSTLVEQAISQNYLEEEDQAILIKWRDKPESWMPKKK
ncbi:orotate phosphoribosyltransferase [Bernardetia litoralis DSM 6794]|uniref:Orotate phosphoribosyltransferase n=1 Tax=Bernardetia litoralis (strain ATCC 23117 / DSM 6794 / NBRC 15988 / NCIMB 1366 / Fx l1 / Sio-4) TaxID=880071 RepID=I4ANR0_BERLS|nr:orotate phosphoribosyltransferase [Bernardetia litoralis DSM 6794]